MLNLILGMDAPTLWGIGLALIATPLATAEIVAYHAAKKRLTEAHNHHARRADMTARYLHVGNPRIGLTYSTLHKTEEA